MTPDVFEIEKATWGPLPGDTPDARHVPRHEARHGLLGKEELLPYKQGVSSCLAKQGAGSCLARPEPGDEGRRRWLRAVGKSPEVAEVCAVYLGIDRSTLVRGDNGVYGVFDDARFLLLPEVRAVRAGQDPVHRPSLARWQVRLLHEAGPVELPPLTVAPVDAPEYVGRVGAGIELLFRCRMFVNDDEPAPYSQRFGSAWTPGGVTQQQVGEALQLLAEAGSIVQAGESRAYGRRSPLWLPGVPA